MAPAEPDLLLSAWAGEVPGGGEALFLLLTTPRADAPAVMPAAAAACGLDPTPGSVTEHVDPGACRVEVGAGGWVRVVFGGDYVTAPVGAEGCALALGTGVAVLAVGYEPMPPGLDGPGYADRFPARVSLGVVRARPGAW